MGDSISMILDLIELAWPKGLQRGLAGPVALPLKGARDLLLDAKKLDNLLFRSVEELKRQLSEEASPGPH